MSICVKRHLVLTLLACMLMALTAFAQENVWQGPQNGPRLRAQLADKEKNLQRRLAVVDVDVQGVALADPTSNQYSMPGQGHLRFRLDNGPYILPLNNRIAFEALTPGKHTIEVTLADNNYRLIAPKIELQITVP